MRIELNAVGLASAVDPHQNTIGEVCGVSGGYIQTSGAGRDYGVVNDSSRRLRISEDVYSFPIHCWEEYVGVASAAALILAARPARVVRQYGSHTFNDVEMADCDKVPL